MSAESEGFEPSDPQCRSTVFETAPFDRSGNSPLGRKNSQILKTPKFKPRMREINHLSTVLFC